ncbi:MAG: hypothetical protein DWQ04_17780 [Chloroflexi bacterium]|nr:MAG: hypothetical protein DWQ04_17780 [Chloroflexota bacterium]
MDGRVKQLSTEQLCPLVCKALGRETAVSTHTITQIHGGSGSMVGGTALYRVSGTTSDETPWSLVLKILYEREGETAVSPYYWKREFELYRSRLLETLPQTGLTTPIIYDCIEYPEACWIWMEDIHEDNQPWTIDNYRLIARRLGRFNGAYLTGHPIPDADWLTDQWHSSIVPPLVEIFDNLDSYLEHPLAQRVLPISEKETILSIWQDREQFAQALTTLPQTLCHIDVFRGNIFHDEESTKLIDWALAGRGAVGEELVCYVALSMYDPEILVRAEMFDHAIFNGYIAGLRDAGWQGDAKQARLGYTCAMTLRGLAGVKQDILLIQEKSEHELIPQNQNRKSVADIADFWANIRRYRLLKMANEARRLLNL